MTRSIFDPTGDPERSGSRFTPPDADQDSHLPEEFVIPPVSLTAGIADFQAPPPSPPVQVTAENGGKLLTVKLSGTLQKEDYQQFLPVIEDAVAHNGKVRLLVELHNFHGWSASALWEDVKFDWKHFSDIERLAIVGESTWEKWMAAFCKPFTTAKVRYFSPEQADDARAWIAQA